MVLIKDNHIEAAGSIRAPCKRCAKRASKLAIEVEVENRGATDEALQLGVERIMLDNMSLDAMREAVRRTRVRAELEASGGINLQSVAECRQPGVDFISVVRSPTRDGARHQSGYYIGA
jgi:nicotinate-nucleotide pyrophosphorylase (carboxylating)